MGSIGLRQIGLALSCVLALGGCAAEMAEEGEEFESMYGPFPFDENLGNSEKGDLVGSAHVLRSIDLDSRISGTFDPAIRVYGFTFEAKVGARINIRLEAKAGRDSADPSAATGLDTVMALYGPMAGDAPGTRISYVDDDSSGTAAQLPAFDVPQDGRYLVVFSSWNDPGRGTYEISLGCSGTEFQCRRPLTTRACTPGTHYIVGGTRLGTQTWDKCEVVLLEETRVEAGAVLTIQPGVTVKGNYVGTGAYGTVRLIVDGSLQAVGTDDQRVLFTALRDQGWGGLVLNGSSHTLEHVSVERARLGVEVNGTRNTFRDLVVDSGETGLRFNTGSSESRAERLKVTQVNNGLEIRGGAVRIEDSTFVGRGGTGTGILGVSGAHSEFRRALVAGFADGLHLTSTELEVYDGTIVNNTRGITVTGAGTGINPPYTCPAAPSVTVSAPTPPSRPLPPLPTTWGRDPVFVRCDIVNNTEYGVRILAPELLVIESCNVTGNGSGIEVHAPALHPDSRIRASNIHDNGRTASQVDARHLQGTLDITGNYWIDISDPDLSANWTTTHSQPQACTTTAVSSSMPTGNGWSCTATTYISNGNYNYSCSQTINPSWSSTVRFTGFSPTELRAGPELRSCSDQVLQERIDQRLAN